MQTMKSAPTKEEPPPVSRRRLLSRQLSSVDGNAADHLGSPRFCLPFSRLQSRNSRDADEDREGDILLDNGLRGGGLILLNLLRESRDSGENEESGDCEISDGLVHGVSHFFKMFVIRFTPRIRTRPPKVTRKIQISFFVSSLRLYAAKSSYFGHIAGTKRHRVRENASKPRL